MRYFKRLLVAALAVGALSSATPLLAHAELQQSSPRAGTNVGAPKTVSVTFDDALVRSFSKLELAMVGHNMTVPLGTAFSKDGKTMIGTPKGKLMAGSYRLDWTAATPDGHRRTGHVDFTIK